ncbi:hypothetical protein [Xenorhabdus sp. SGI246]|uniref:hypothetical protein n=1 Tax=Xenorhabdus sp. SGI246 TaxID=3158263 RepID=UPI00349F3B07
MSDSLSGEAGVSLSGFGCSLAAASLSAVNLPKVTPWVPRMVNKSDARVEILVGTAKGRKVQCQTVEMSQWFGYGKSIR